MRCAWLRMRCRKAVRLARLPNRSAVRAPRPFELTCGWLSVRGWRACLCVCACVQWMGVFMAVFGVALLLLLGLIHNWHMAAFTTIAFFAGVITSVVCGYIGMAVGQYYSRGNAEAETDDVGPGELRAGGGRRMGVQWRVAPG